jgi:hypothetical protein
MLKLPLYHYGLCFPLFISFYFYFFKDFIKIILGFKV